MTQTEINPGSPATITEGSLSHMMIATAIAVVDGNVYVTGSSAGVFTSLDYATIKYGPARE